MRLILVALLGLLAPFSFAANPDKENKKHEHPLDPLTAAELKAAVKLLDKKHGAPKDVLYAMVALDEPTKDELAQFGAGKPIARRAAAVILDARRMMTIEAIVDLTAAKVVTWKELKNVKGMTTAAEIDEAERIVRNDPGWQKAMAARGFVNPDNVFVAVWADGAPTKGKLDKRFLYRAIAYDRWTSVNPYGTPIEGVVALVDLELRKVIEITDTGKTPVPPAISDFFSERVRGPVRKDLKPLETRQPEGASFTIRGHEIQWQKWKLRCSMHPREGLVLHTLGYEEKDKGKTTLRPILHRASLSEMVVPYGDADPTWNWRAPFDQGDYGIGWAANTLTKGADVPENAVLLDAVFANQWGQPYDAKGVVAVYERDGGLLWKHQEDTPRRMIACRARELVISWITTLGNYDYGFSWVLRQDGSIEAEVDMTGVVLAKAVASDKCAVCKQIDKLPANVTKATTITPEGDQQFGTLVGKNVIGVNHQHVFNFRLDFDIDGAKNSFSEMNVRPIAVKGNSYGNAIVQEETIFAKEKEARRSVSVEHSRTWKIFNPNQRTTLGHHPGYALLPGANAGPVLSKDASVRKRAGFMDHHVWVTRQSPQEMHAAGDYTRQNPDPGGLPTWSGDESIVNQDLVLWYTMAITHVPRPEEWPVMPTAKGRFRLVPWGFFTRNPALDVPVVTK